MSENEKVTLLCPECGDLIEVTDPRALLLAQHIAQFCANTKGLSHE